MADTAAQLVELISISASALTPLASSLDKPIDRSVPDPAPDAIPPAIFEALATLQAAANSLCDLILPPKLVMLQNSMLYHIPSCVAVHVATDAHSAMRIVMHTSCAEILRDHPDGLEVAEIARPSGISPRLLERSLRLLATRNIFREVRTGVFATNKLSSVLDTGKDLAIVLGGDLDSRWTDADPMSAMIAHDIDEGFPAAGHLLDALRDDPSTENPSTLAMQRGFGHPTFWDLVDGESWRNTRFCCAMQSTFGVSNALPRVYDWSKFVSGPIVDIGGADGSAMAAIRKLHPTVRCVIQDRPDVAAAAVKHWAQHDPGALKSGHVQIQAADFFAPQPVLNASAFFLRYVLHDLSDLECVKVLTHLREAALPFSKLFIAENVILPVCGASGRDGGKLQGHGLPPPLLPNGGYSASLIQCLDMHMMSITTGRERTLEDFDEILRVSGWRLKNTYDLVHLNSFKLIEAEPASQKPIALHGSSVKPAALLAVPDSPDKRLRRPLSGRLRHWAEQIVPPRPKVDGHGVSSDKSDKSMTFLCAA